MTSPRKAPVAVDTSKKPEPEIIESVGPDVWMKPLGPIQWQCEQLRIVPGGIVMYAGFGFSGKSIWLQNYALHVATGKKLFGQFRVKQGRVLHLDFEQGDDLTYERYQRLAAGLGIERDDLADMLRIAIFPKTKSGKPVYIDDQEAEDILSKTFEGYSTVIIDSNRASTPRTDENSSAARLPLDTIMRVCTKQKIVPNIVHHCKKTPSKANQTGGGARMMIRGSGALYDALRNCFVFSGEKGAPIRVEHEKETRRGILIPDFGFRVHGQEDAPLTLEYLDKEAIDTAGNDVKKANEEQEVCQAHGSILALLGNGDFKGSRADLAGELKVNARMCGIALRRLEAAGRVTVTNKRPPTIHLVEEENPFSNGVSTLEQEFSV